MRLLIYNIRYCLGTGWGFHLPLPFSGYLRQSRENLDHISGFINELKPDIVGLLEVDTGSFRSHGVDQAKFIADKLGHYSLCESKYGKFSFVSRLPLVNKQANAFLTSRSIRDYKFHYFARGVKRLVIELELEDCTIFLVHLSLRHLHRQSQLSQLYSIFKEVDKPVIVAGDFNAFWGEVELELFQKATGLINANTEGRHSFPSSRPWRQLDFILHSSDIKILDFDIPDIRFSDHRPLICDFEVAGR